MNVHRDWKNFQIPWMPPHDGETFVIDHLDVSPELARQLDLEAKLASFGGIRITPPTPGQKVVRLMMKPQRFGDVMMSDTRDEIVDHADPIKVAAGERYLWTGDEPPKTVLIAGLGLGLVTDAILQIPHIEKVVVFEINEELANHVGDILRNLRGHGDRLEVRVEDVLAYRPEKGERYDMAWFDIWPHITTDNLSQMATLHRRWCRRVSWYGSWKHGLLKSMQSRGF